MRHVIKVVTEALGVSELAITNIQAMGGMTNINYKFSIRNEHYIVRIPGLGTEQLINRQEEKRNLEIGVQLGINPEHIYINPETGVKITRVIPAAITLTQAATKKEEMMRKVTGVLRKLHSSDVQMGNRFNLYALMDHYENKAIEENVQFFPHFEEVKMEVQGVKSDYDLLGVLERPSHIDSQYENLVLDGEGKLYLIDWEYSGMFDPLWDVTTHMIESAFNAEEKALFLRYYFQREATEDEEKIILMHKVFQDYLWSIWTLFKEAKGDDFGSYGHDRFERLRRNLRTYAEKYDKSLMI